MIESFKRIYIGLMVYMLPVLAFADGGASTPESNGGGTTGPTTQLLNPLAGGVDSIEKLLKLILNNIVLPIGSVVIVIMIIYSGFLFVTARGNEDKIGDAKRTLTYVVIGAAILLGAAVISAVIGGTLCQIAPSLPGCPNIGNLQ